MPKKKVNTATLIRGSLYTFRHPDHTPQNPKEALRFERGIPLVIEESKILSMLENMYDEIMDGDREVYEKPRFLVERGVPQVETFNAEGTRARPHRLSAKRKVRRRSA